MTQKLTAFEAASFLATGKPVPFDRRHELFRCRLSTWGVFWFDHVRLRDRRALTLHELANAFEARATFDSYPHRIPGSIFDWPSQELEVCGPCCLWMPVSNDGVVTKNPTNSYDEASSKIGPAKLWRVALRMRRHLRRRVSPAELAAMLREDIAADQATEHRLEVCLDNLKTAILGKDLTAYGLPGCWVKGNFHTNLPQRIPAEFFANEKNTLREDGWATLDPERTPAADWYAPGTRSWGEVWFYYRDIAKLIEINAPKPKQQTENLASDRTGAAGRPSSRHLVFNEYERLDKAGKRSESLAAQAKALSSWLKITHPNLSQMTPKTVENVIRAIYRQNEPRK